MWLKIIVNFLAVIVLCNGLYNSADELEIVDEIPITYRLPNNSIPLAYSLTLVTDVNQGIFEFSGRVEIHIRVTEPTNEITLHYRQISITSVELRSNSVLRRNLEFSTIPSHDFLKINLTTVSPVNDEFILDIQYNGILRGDGMGFYRAYYDYNGTRVWYGTTQLQTTDARHVMPCYDEPGIRAPIQLAIIHSPTYHAVSNTPIYRTEPVGLYTRTTFEPTPPMQTYLLAFLISPFEYVSNNEVRVEQRIYAKPSTIQNDYSDLAIDIVKPLLELFEEKLNFNFPLKKIDHAAITQHNFEAMENFGLITYSENRLLFDPNTPSSAQVERKKMITRLIARKFAHQWFGNIVSPKWWTYTWLNEGFASLFESYIPDLFNPELNYMNNFVTTNMPYAFLHDIGDSWSMNQYVESPAELWNKFNFVSNQKAGCVLRMFQEALTPQTFAKGLNYYLNDNNMKAATPHELHVALQRSYNEDFPGSGNLLDIEMLMSMWEDQAGYPLVSVEVSGNNIVLTQRRYPTSNGEIYAIPLTFSSNLDQFSVTTPIAWITTENFTMTAPNPNDWIILNNQQVGYYRVDYSTELWHLIINQLKTDFAAIHPINRAVLQDEIYLAWKDLNRVTAGDILDSLRYLSIEEEPLVWNRADTFFSELQSRLMGTHSHRHFRRFIKDLTRHHLERLGFEGVEDEPSDHTSLRNYAKKWSCTVWDEDCINNEYEKWVEFNNTNNPEITFDYCFAMTHLELDTFNQILEGVTTDVNYPSRQNYLSYLGCNSNYTNLMSLLMSTIDMENILTNDERIYFMRTALKGGYQGMTAMFHFIDVHFIPIVTISREEFVATVQLMGETVTSECQINTLALLRNHALQYGFLTNDEARVVTNWILKWTNWNAQHLDLIDDWFEFSYREPILPTTTVPPTTTIARASSLFLSLTLLTFSILLSLFFVKF